MGVNSYSLPKTFTRQRRDCDLNPGPSAPESSTLTTRLPSHPPEYGWTTFTFLPYVWGALSDAAIRASVCLSVCLSQLA